MEEAMLARKIIPVSLSRYPGGVVTKESAHRHAIVERVPLSTDNTCSVPQHE
ncbi:hypothetical protein PC110_g21186 [Phytophthora cactorum]|uniref:Uncharacterized protein n=1 Tax=Phytophthora cactorum TaxID=29920 RepID=A0A329RCL1_9STRA|nr:hypothetical protein PC117_g23939 [Phytophthora cactorum]KAG3001280.1 hypothetical protein PC120_g20364 [Phytophthora cactorum]KAG3020669.1 hypothetical protein PC119_g9870 [Phytophthora cactorum]KAG3146025.1 hypothetical protein PC128_g24093 [Phytophthora cactorum]KAG4040810.1 hypothetical protein PC123_g23653 [Phytophthora cactorum]